MATKRLLPILAGCTLLSACGFPAYIPLHDQPPEVAAMARLECKALAEGMAPPIPGGFVAAAGKPAFVAGAMGGYAVGLAVAAAIRHQHELSDYDDCMIAHGFARQP